MTTILAGRIAAGGVIGLAFGAFGEWSLTVDGLLQRAAQAAAPRWMDRIGAPTLEDTAKTLVRLWQQELGMCVLQANAHLLLSKVRQAFEANLQRQMPPDQAPVGGGPEGGDSALARWGDFAYWRRDPIMGFFLRDARANRHAPGAHAGWRGRQ